MKQGNEIDIEALANLYNASTTAVKEAFNPVYLGKESPELSGPAEVDCADVLELERISYLVSPDPLSVGSLPKTTVEQQTDYPLMKKIEHAKKCEACARGVIIYAQLRPS